MELHPGGLPPRRYLEQQLAGEQSGSPIFRALKHSVEWRLAHRQTAGMNDHGNIVLAQQRAEIERKIAAERSGPDGPRYSEAFEHERNTVDHFGRYLTSVRESGVARDERFSEAARLMLADLAEIDQSLPQPPAAPES